MRITRGNLAPVLAFVLLLPLASMAAPGEETPAKAEVTRWEINLAIIKFFTANQIGIIKSVGYYVVPRYLNVALSLSYIIGGIQDVDFEAPFSLNPFFNLPLFKDSIVPFFTAGIGASLKGTVVTNAGGGFKVKVGSHAHVLAEYRHFDYTSHHNIGGSGGIKRAFDCVGIGISYHD